MDVELSGSIDIGAPIDEVFRWVSDDGYTTLWDNRTISRAAGRTVRRRGAELTVHREERFANPPMMFAVEITNDEESERFQFDLAPIVNGTRLTYTTVAYNAPPRVQKMLRTKREQLDRALFVYLEQIKSLAEGGRVPMPATPMSNELAAQYMSEMSDAGKKAWEDADPFARERAASLVASGTGASNAQDAWLAVELATAIMRKTGRGGILRAAAMVLFDLVVIGYGVVTDDKIFIGIFAVLLVFSALGLKSRIKVRGVVEQSLEANTEFLLMSQQVEHLMSRLWREGRDAQLVTINELAAIQSENSLNRRIEVALERVAASPDPSVAAAGTHALQQRQQSIAHLLHQQAA